MKFLNDKGYIPIIVVIGSAFALLFLILTFGWVNIHPTEAGVEINKLAGNISKNPLGVGYHFYNRWKTDVEIYRVAARAFPPDTKESEDAKGYTLELKTNDGQNVNVDLTTIYALRINEVPALHQQVGRNYEDQILLPQIRSEARLAIGAHSAEEIYQGKVRDTIQKSVATKLRESLTKFPAIDVQDVLIRHFQFSPEFEKAIEQKKLAAQQVEINKNKALAQEEEAKRQEAEARGAKLKVLQEAEGQAQSQRIKSDAYRYAKEQEAAGNLAIYKSEAEGKRLQAEALGSGENVVAMEFARNISPKLRIYGIPIGERNTSILDLNGLVGGMLKGTITKTE